MKQSLSDQILGLLREHENVFLTITKIMKMFKDKYSNEVPKSTLYDHLNRLCKEKLIEHNPKGSGYRIFQKWEEGRKLLEPHIGFLRRIYEQDYEFELDKKKQLYFNKDGQKIDEVPKEFKMEFEFFTNQLEKLIHFGFIEFRLNVLHLNNMACKLMKICVHCYKDINFDKSVIEVYGVSDDGFEMPGYCHEACLLAQIVDYHKEDIHLKRKKKRKYEEINIPDELYYSSGLCEKCGLPFDFKMLFPNFYTESKINKFEFTNPTPTADSKYYSLLCKELFGDIKTLFWAQNWNISLNRAVGELQISKFIRHGESLYHPECLKRIKGGDSDE